jgi:RNA recognition motif-containing protein
LKTKVWLFKRKAGKFFIYFIKEFKMNIYVGNLSPEVKEEDLNELFSQHGKVSSAKVIRDMFTQESRGFGFVEMPAQAEAMKAIETLNTFDLKGKKIVVNEARPPRDRRGGGRGAGGHGRGRRS